MKLSFIRGLRKSLIVTFIKQNKIYRKLKVLNNDIKVIGTTYATTIEY